MFMNGFVVRLQSLRKEKTLLLQKVFFFFNLDDIQNNNKKCGYCIKEGGGGHYYPLVNCQLSYLFDLQFIHFVFWLGPGELISLIFAPSHLPLQSNNFLKNAAAPTAAVLMRRVEKEFRFFFHFPPFNSPQNYLFVQQKLINLSSLL